MYGRILVPVDGSQASAAGLREAIKIAKNQGSEIRLVHIVDTIVLDCGYCAGVYTSDAVEILRKFGREILDGAEMEIRREGLKTDSVLLETVAEPAADLILAQAKSWSADLIVMGTHGRRGLARIAMGSNAEAVVRACSVPVLLVRDSTKQSTPALRAQASAA
jgi:nucleotide-binding universal stress UspA family protein